MCHVGALGASLTSSHAQTPSHPAAPASSSAAAQPGNLPGSAPKPKFKLKLGQGPPSLGESFSQPGDQALIVLPVSGCRRQVWRPVWMTWQQRNIGLRGVCMGNEMQWFSC